MLRILYTKKIFEENMSRTAAPLMTSILKKSAAAPDYNEDVQKTKENRKTIVKMSSSDHISYSNGKSNEYRNEHAKASLTTSRREKVSGKEKSASVKKSSDEAFEKDDDGKATKKLTKKEVKLISVKTTLKRGDKDRDHGKAKKVTSKQKVAIRAQLSSLLHGLNVLDTRAKEKPKKEIAAKAVAKNVPISTIKQRLSTIPRETLQIPNVDSFKRLSVFAVRNEEDSGYEFKDEDYTTEPVLVFAPPKYKPNYDILVPSRGPSYSGYELPVDVKSKIRYAEARKRYEKQFQDEIHNHINYQPTAMDSLYFTRHMAYTTLWPPLHTKREVDETSKLLKPLTKKEQKRLKYLMENDIPFWSN